MTMKKAFALAVAAVAVSLTFTQAAQAGPRLDKIALPPSAKAAKILRGCERAMTGAISE